MYKAESYNYKAVVSNTKQVTHTHGPQVLAVFHGLLTGAESNMRYAGFSPHNYTFNFQYDFLLELFGVIPTAVNNLLFTENIT
jgi:hypothetical protein